MNVLFVWGCVMTVVAVAAMGCCYVQNADSTHTDGVIHLPAGDPHAPHGVWRKQVVWKARWIKEWKQEKVWKPVWKKVWGPVEIQEWIPIPKPPLGWESKT